MTVALRIAKLCRLMRPDLPQTIEPARLAMSGEKLAGQYAIDEMSRLVERLHDQSGIVDFHLAFKRDEDQKLTLITGDVSTEVSLICQRCLEPMSLSMKSQVNLGVIRKSVDLSILPRGCEPLYEEDAPFVLRDLIEDELILALPLAVMHEQNGCEATKLLDELNKSVIRNPFSVLEKLSTKSNE
ncbi:MAG TPA: YceD family protein [Gammaproteobacteria bacterium]